MTYDYIPPIKSGVQRETLKYLVDIDYPLSVKDLMNHTGAARPSSIIANLRGNGWSIELIMRQGVNRFGDNVRYGRYYLTPEWKTKARAALNGTPCKNKK